MRTIPRNKYVFCNNKRIFPFLSDYRHLFIYSLNQMAYQIKEYIIQSKEFEILTTYYKCIRTKLYILIKHLSSTEISYALLYVFLLSVKIILNNLIHLNSPLTLIAPVYTCLVYANNTFYYRMSYIYNKKDILK